MPGFTFSQSSFDSQATGPAASPSGFFLLHPAAKPRPSDSPTATTTPNPVAIRMRRA